MPQVRLPPLTNQQEPSRLVEKLALAMAIIGSIWFTLATLWELFGPFGPGHLAASASVGVAGENMASWGIAAPVIDYRHSPPTTAHYYCHHPWGIYWITAPLTWVLGHHDFVCRLAPALMSCATPGLLYGIGRAAWGPVAGGITALSYSTIPIALSFSQMNGFEVPLVFACALAAWGYVHFRRTWRRRWMAISLLGFLLMAHIDWPGYIFAGSVLGFMFLRGLVFPPRWYGSVDRRRFTLWWGLAASIAVLSFVFYVVAFQRADQVGELLTQGRLRSTGYEKSITSVVEGRRYWLDASFTPLGIWLGKLAAPVLALRLLFLRRELDLFPLALLLMSLVHYLAFPQAADVHIFWPYPFAAYLALGVGCLTGSLEGLARRVVRRVRKTSPAECGPALAAALVALLVPLAMLRDATAALIYSRESGGRFDERGHLIHPDDDKQTLIRWLGERMPPKSGAQFHSSMKQSLWVAWTLGHPVQSVATLPTTPHQGSQRYFLMDTRFSRSSDLGKIADKFAVLAVGPFWLADRGVPKAPLQGLGFARREPSLLEWYFRSGTSPVLEIERDPFITWEQRHHFQPQAPNPTPKSKPQTSEQLRVAHNTALFAADTAASVHLFEELSRGLDRGSRRDLGEVELLGHKIEAGVLPRLVTYFKVIEPPSVDYHFVIHASAHTAPSGSLVPLPTKEREVGMPFAIPSSRWKVGYLYASISELIDRPGKERLVGSWETVRGRRGSRKPVLLVESW